MKRLFALLLCAAVLLSLFSCANGNAPVETEAPRETEQKTKEEVSAAEKKIASLASRDFEGREFRIATDDASLIVPASSSNYVGKKLYERNAAIEKKFNVKIRLTEESGVPTVGEKIRAEALSGTDYCDLAIISSSVCQQLVSADALLNVTSIPYVVTAGGGVFAEATRSMTFGDTVYALTGDLCYSVDPLYVVYFNRTLLSATGLPDLYQLVRENQWDHENFQLYAEEAYSLGRIGGQKIYGFCSPERTETLLQAFWAASDLEYVSNNYGTRPALAYDSSDIREAFTNRAKKLLYSTVAYFNNANASLDVFRDGQALFMVAPLSQMTELTGVFDWGIVPMPKFDINQNGLRTYQKTSFQVAAFPKGIADIDFSGMITQALFQASEGYSADLGLTKYLNLYLPSSEDAEMLRLALERPYYDPTEFFGPIYSDYNSATQILIQRVVSSEGNYKQLYQQNSRLFETFVNGKFS